MTHLSDIKRDYRHTLEAYMDAQKANDTELMRRYSADLVRIADAMERAIDG